MNHPPYKVHAYGTPTHTKCGLDVVQRRKRRDGKLPLAKWPEDITCCNCIEHVYGPMIWPPRGLYPRTKMERAA